MPQTRHDPILGWDDGWLTSIIIKRRHGKHVGKQYHPSGWDLVDTETNQVIAEFNDETAPPSEWKTGMRQGFAPQDGNELGEMFKEIYRICYETTIDAMKLMASAIPEHKDSSDGEPIAQIVIGAYNRLPQTTVKKNKVKEKVPF